MPVEEAAYVLIIANSTGWTEDYIRWRLPLARGRAYEHAALLMAGHDMRWPDRERHGLGRWWSTIRAKYQRSTMNHEPENPSPED